MYGYHMQVVNLYLYLLIKDRPENKVTLCLLVPLCEPVLNPFTVSLDESLGARSARLGRSNVSCPFVENLQ